ncbi:hypothetical protein HDU97_010049 [Phlyctochytrium planicorne]|nr:hypothetical protein HDU97_010049 [Phlyctochytrium planicorne]
MTEDGANVSIEEQRDIELNISEALSIKSFARVQFLLVWDAGVITLAAVASFVLLNLIFYFHGVMRPGSDRSVLPALAAGIVKEGFVLVNTNSNVLDLEEMLSE